MSAQAGEFAIDEAGAERSARGKPRDAAAASHAANARILFASSRLVPRCLNSSAQALNPLCVQTPLACQCGLWHDLQRRVVTISAKPDPLVRWLTIAALVGIATGSASLFLGCSMWRSVSTSRFLYCRSPPWRWCADRAVAGFESMGQSAMMRSRVVVAGAAPSPATRRTRV